VELAEFYFAAVDVFMVDRVGYFGPPIPSGGLDYVGALTLVYKTRAVPAQLRVSEAELSWLSESNASYRVDSCPDLGTNTWMPLPGLVQGTGSRVSVFDTPPADSTKRLYRVAAFGQSNSPVTARAVVEIRTSEVEICWPSISNATYQVDYRSVLTTNAWVHLFTNIVASGERTCVADRLARGTAQRFYRVIGPPQQ
jgi:hypothetical protein